MPAVQLKFGPTDHGRPVTADELDAAEYAEGFSYEVIDGRVYVSPVPNLPEHVLERWLRRKLERFSDDHPELIGWVANKARVFVPDRPELTVPEPDLAVYRDNPSEIADGELNWADFHPFIVAEVLVENDPEKDLVRNVELYFQVPSIAEYWVLDARDSTAQPVLIARRRWGTRWVLTEVPYGETFTTRTLPGFDLLVDPRK